MRACATSPPPTRAMADASATVPNLAGGGATKDEGNDLEGEEIILLSSPHASPTPSSRHERAPPSPSAGTIHFRNKAWVPNAAVLAMLELEAAAPTGASSPSIQPVNLYLEKISSSGSTPPAGKPIESKVVDETHQVCKGFGARLNMTYVMTLQEIVERHVTNVNWCQNVELLCQMQRNRVGPEHTKASHRLKSLYLQHDHDHHHGDNVGDTGGGDGKTSGELNDADNLVLPAELADHVHSLPPLPKMESELALMQPPNKLMGWYHLGDRLELDDARIWPELAVGAPDAPDAPVGKERAASQPGAVGATPALLRAAGDTADAADTHANGGASHSGSSKKTKEGEPAEPCSAGDALVPAMINCMPPLTKAVVLAALAQNDKMAGQANGKTKASGDAESALAASTRDAQSALAAFDPMTIDILDPMAVSDAVTSALSHKKLFAVTQALSGLAKAIGVPIPPEAREILGLGEDCDMDMSDMPEPTKEALVRRTVQVAKERERHAAEEARVKAFHAAALATAKAPAKPNTPEYWQQLGKTPPPAPPAPAKPKFRHRPVSKESRGLVKGAIPEDFRLTIHDQMTNAEANALLVCTTLPIPRARSCALCYTPPPTHTHTHRTAVAPAQR